MAQRAERIEISHQPKHDKPSIIIVLLHGLNGSGTSFVNKENGVSMQQLLSIDIPCSIILTYIYPNSMKNASSKRPSSSTIKGKAELFLKILSNYVCSDTPTPNNEEKNNDNDPSHLVMFEQLINLDMDTNLSMTASMKFPHDLNRALRILFSQ